MVSALNFEEFDLTTGSGNDTVTQAGVVNGTVIRGNDTISTGAGNDTINAGLGSNDRVDGGTGTDLLTVDFSAGDTGSEMWFYVNSGSGYAYRYVSATNSSYLDYLSFSNIEQFNIIGTSKNDNITTSTGNDIINAGDGNDTVNGGGGNDTLNGGAGTDKLTLDLSAQTAALSIANYRSAGINIAGVVSAVNFEEFDITTGSGNDTVTQAGVVNGVVIRNNDTLRTGAGNDSINAGLGSNDRVDGGTGTDLLTVDFSAGDTGAEMQFFVNSGSGYAYRYVSATNFSYLDYLSFSNIERFNITGTSKNDTITTDAGNDTLDGRQGADAMTGGTGNDVYVVDNVGDTVTETSTIATEIDTVQSAITYTLGANLENLTLTGTAAINGTGNTLNNSLNGNTANNSLTGGAGNDTLNGRAGNDTLVGGTGADRFTFSAPTEGVDTITDFTISQTDRIVVSAAGFRGGLTAGAAITAAQFGLGTAATTTAQRFLYDSATGALRFDVDGSGATAAVQIATLSNRPTLSNTSITVIA